MNIEPHIKIRVLSGPEDGFIYQDAEMVVSVFEELFFKPFQRWGLCSLLVSTYFSV